MGEQLEIPKSGRGEGVLVLHSWWGLNPFYKDLCGRLAGEGYVALAADLYDGKVADTEEEARRLRTHATASRKEPAYKYLMRMIRYLAAHESVGSGRIGVVGFSMGGHWAWWLSQRAELPIRATVAFYAARNGDYTKSRSAFLGHFAETDPYVSAAGIGRLRRSLEKAGREFAFHAYAGTGHWFFEENRVDAFHPEAAETAWERTTAFLKTHLKAAPHADRRRKGAG